MVGVYVSEHLIKLHLSRKGLLGRAKAKTGIGKSDLPGLQGARGNVTLSYCDKVRAPRLYPDPRNWIAPPGSNRSSSGGDKAAEASGVEGREGDLANMQAVT